MYRWNLSVKPHFVTDAAFGSVELIEEIHKWGGSITTSVGSDVNSWFWSILSRNVAPKSWRSASKNEMLASIHKIIDANTQKMITQQIISTGFTAEKIPIESLEPTTFQDSGTT
jgi:hypothetical protein